MAQLLVIGRTNSRRYGLLARFVVIAGDGVLVIGESVTTKRGLMLAVFSLTRLQRSTAATLK